MTVLDPRYAVYFAPAADSPFWRFGCSWLGRDPETEAPQLRPELDGAAAADWSPQALDAVTASPSSYGFHATLKPPFRLLAGQNLEALEAAVMEFAAGQTPFVCPEVAPAALGRFIAFRMAEPVAEMHALAAAAVKAFESFRGLQTPDELAKRRAADLTDYQEAMLVRWGYPYVMAEFRFHMTLTSAIADPDIRNRLAANLASMAAASGAAGPMRVDGVALYEQPSAGAPFRLLRRLPFGG